MKDQNTSRMSIADKPILVGIGLGALYWILESAIHAFIFHRGNLVEQILTSDPNEIWMRSVAVCILIAFGGYAQFVTTRHKRMEETLKAAHRKLERAHRELKETQAQLIQAGKMAAIGQLAGGVAHELNNPLTGVLIYARRMLKKADDEALRDNEAFRDFPRSLRVIDEAALRCKHITDSLLAFSRQTKLEFAPLDVNQVIENTLMLIGSQLKSHRITLVQELQPDLPPVIGNANQLQQVFTNIIINAQQAMPDGGQLVIKSEVRSPKSKVQGRESRDAELRLRTMDYVTVSFTDTGCGIPEENLDKIFEPFFTTRPVGQGTGLGLSISYGIVSAHKGFIEVESQVGVGSTFTVFLPVGE